jgi:hypothetical protein
MCLRRLTCRYWANHRQSRRMRTPINEHEGTPAALGESPPALAEPLPQEIRADTP